MDRKLVVPARFHFAYGVDANHYRAVLSEFDSMMGPVSRETTQARRSHGDMPLIVLTGENTDKLPTLSADDQAAAFSAWNTMHDELAHLSTSSTIASGPASGATCNSADPKPSSTP